MKTDYIFELEMKVRDYECDLQGIVNNANYQHYIEHTRHEFLLAQGISFADLHAQGIDAVVARLNMAFKTPLKSVIFVSSKNLPPSAIIGIHPNDNTATVWLTFGDLLALLSELQVEVKLVEL